MKKHPVQILTKAVIVLEKKKQNLLIFLVIFCAVLLIAAILTVGFLSGQSDPTDGETAWVLRSYGNGVALYRGKELSAVYGNIVLDDLPAEDVALLDKGISFSTKEEAERALEDYDG